MKNWAARNMAILFAIMVFSSCHRPQGLQFTGFRNFQVQPVSFSNSHINCEVGVYNPNKFDINIKHLEASIMLSGNSLGNYLLDSSLVLNAESPFYLPVHLEVKNGSLLANMISVFAGDSLPYTLKGRVRGGRKTIMTEMPFDYSGHLTQKDFQF